MAQQTINLGTIADDGTGDTLRVGGDKINDNFTELYTDYLPKAGGTLTGDLVVPDEAYDATAWNGSLEVPTKNAVRDKIESLGSGITELDDIPDVNAPTPSDGDVLTWDSTPGEWVSAAPTGGSNALDDLTDVDAPTPSDGDVLTFDSGSGDWVPAAPSAGANYAYHFIGGAAATTVTINNTAYSAQLPFVFFLDRDTFPATHFRLVVRGNSTEAAQTVTMQLTDVASPTTPIHTGGNDLAITNTNTTHDSGWRTFDDGGSGLDLLCFALKGSNGSVDLSVLYANIMFKID